MNNRQIKEYIYSLGETAAKLHDAELSLYKIADDDAKTEKNLSILVDLVDEHADAQNIIAQLSHDSRTDIREIAAALINYLWRYWKYIPYHEDKKSEYEKTIQNYARRLSWTVPLIKAFILDKAEQPVLISLYNIWEMEYAKPTEIALLRDAALSVTKLRSIEIRKALVRTLADYYFDNDKALHLLDKPALQFYIDATYDSDEQIRDWALFELHTSVENLNDQAAKAFLDAFDRESPESDAYMEAAIGMARMRLEYNHLKPVILDNLSQTYCGSGWFDIAEYMHTEEIFKALNELHDKIYKYDANDRRLPSLKEILEMWDNE